MSVAARKLAHRAAVALSKEQILRLVRFPAVRKAISGGLERRAPLAVDIPRGGRFVRFRMEDPRRFHPRLFSTIRIGKRGTMLVIGTRLRDVRKRAELAAFVRRARKGMGRFDRRGLIQQLRSKGVIGAATIQSVLVPKERVAAAVARFAGSAAGRRAAMANPILATLGFNPLTLPERRMLLRRSRYFAKARQEVKGKVIRAFIRGREDESHGIARARRVEDLWGTKREHSRRNPGGVKIGDRVKVSRDFLRAIGAFTGPMGQARGVVTQLQDLGGGIVLATVRWDRGSVPEKMNTKNLLGAEKLERENPRHPSKRRVMCANPRHRHARNVGANPSGAIRIPFRDGQKVTTARVAAWITSLPAGRFRQVYENRFHQALRQYKRFHLGSEPTSWTWKTVPMGAQKALTDVDFVVSEGKEWMAPYQVPPHSRKYDRATDGRYVHAHGESKIDVELSRVAPKAKLPERFHTADGKFVGVVPTRNVKITDWYRG